MKKVIKGKMYNTKTAKYLCSWDKTEGDIGEEDYEHLHRKDNGEYFIQGHNYILPLTRREAGEWVELATDNDGDAYELIFGITEE